HPPAQDRIPAVAPGPGAGAARADAPRPPAQRRAARGPGRLHQCRQVHAVQPAHRRRRLRRRPPVRHPGSDHAPGRGRGAAGALGHGRLRARPAARTGGRLPLDAVGSPRRRPAAARRRCRRRTPRRTHPAGRRRAGRNRRRRHSAVAGLQQDRQARGHGATARSGNGRARARLALGPHRRGPGSAARCPGRAFPRPVPGRRAGPGPGRRPPACPPARRRRGEGGGEPRSGRLAPAGGTAAGRGRTPGRGTGRAGAAAALACGPPSPYLQSPNPLKSRSGHLPVGRRHGASMAWNTPGKGNQDPWKGKDPGNEVDAFLSRLKGMFGGGGGRRGGGPSGGFNAAPWILAVVAVWLVFNSFKLMDERQRGVVLRFGEYNRIITPGPNFKWPWPIETVRVDDANQVVEVTDEVRVLTRDENLIDIKFNAQYRREDPRMYLFGSVDPEKTLRDAAESAVREVVGRSDMDTVLFDRAELIIAAQERLQESLDFYRTGLRVVNFNLQDARPPEEVKQAFDDAIAAREDKNRIVNEARAYASKVLPEARG